MEDNKSSLHSPASGSGAATKSLRETSELFGFSHKGITHFKNATIMNASAPMSDRMAAYVQELQAEIVEAMELIEAHAKDPGNVASPPPQVFLRDAWTRPEEGTGGGLSCVLQNGTVFEKAGVMTTIMRGDLTPASAKQMRARKPDNGSFPEPKDDKTPIPFFAAGISIVIHPHNPFAATAHMNYRYFEVRDPETKEPRAWWFGGGADLTPMYLNEEDAIHFHQQLREPCDRHLGPDGYPALKKWCDEYFYLPHRQETRGVGGLFFDDLDANSPHVPSELANRPDEAVKEALFAFIRDAGRAFVPAYAPLVAHHMAEPFTSAHKEWQQLRRGRYVEFNLAFDRGTKFGLATPNARTESILVSLPLTARWEYFHTPAKGSPEENLMEVLRQPRAWLN